MFGNLFKRLAPGRAVKANPTCDSPGQPFKKVDKHIVEPLLEIGVDIIWAIFKSSIVKPICPDF
jgi:hypothetical protein